MNLRQLLEQRAERGTHIGSTALTNRIEADLGQRRFSFSQPGWGFAVAAAMTLVLVGGVLLALRPDSEPAPPADTSTTTTTLESTSTTTPQSAAAMDLAAWIGTYEWQESSEGPDSSLFMAHKLNLAAELDGVLTGYLAQDGSGTDRYVEVIATPQDQYLDVFAAENGSPYTTARPLFRLSGEPGQPLTTLDQLLTYRTDLPREGTYFEPPAPDPADAALANRRIVWDFRPGVDDPETLRTALETYDSYGYDLIRLIDEGDQATRDVVFDFLKQPSAWHVQTLALIQSYGAPGGTRANPEAWPSDVKWTIFSALDEAAQATFGDTAELMIDLQLAVAEQEMAFCEEELGGCEWGAAWYTVPQVVSSVEGQGGGIAFSGTMVITPDTGAGDSYAFSALRTDDGWVLQEGYRTKKPFIAVMGPRSLVTTTPDLQLTGYADPLATVTIDGRSVANDLQGGYLIFDAWDTAPEPGIHELVVAATLDGETNTDTIQVRYEPDATPQFAFIRGIDTTESVPALIVDYAELLSGDEAVQAAIEDGELPADQAEGGLPNDFYIRNQNPQLRTLPVADEAPIYLFDYTTTGEFDYDPINLDTLVRIIETSDSSAHYFPLTDYPVWLVVKDNAILQVTPQYLP